MTYAARVLATRPANLLAYWKCNDFFYQVIADSSGNGYDGAGNNLTMLRRWIGEETIALFDGTADYVDIYSAGFAAAFNGDTGTLMLWVRLPDAATWGEVRTFFNVGNGTVQYVRIRTIGSSTIQFMHVTSTTTLADVSAALPVADTTWHHLVMTWDKPNNQVKAFWDGAQLGTTGSGMGTWSGAPNSTSCYIGASSSGAVTTWSRFIGHVALWDSVLTPDEIKALAWVDLWTDRVSADLTTRTFKAFWNIEDWMRVKRAADWVHGQILDYDGVNVSLNALTVPAYTTIPTADNINDLVENIELLRTASGLPTALGLAALDYDYEAGVGAVAPDYEDVNAWENNLQLLKEGLDNVAPYHIHCGVAAAGQTWLWQSRFRGV